MLVLYLPESLFLFRTKSFIYLDAGNIGGSPLIAVFFIGNCPPPSGQLGFKDWTMQRYKSLTPLL